MKRSELLAMVEELRPNSFSTGVKKRWLKMIEQKLITDVYDRCQPSDFGKTLRKVGECTVAELPQPSTLVDGDYYVITADGSTGDVTDDILEDLYTYCRKNNIVSGIEITTTLSNIVASHTPSSIFMNIGAVEAGEYAVIVRDSNNAKKYAHVKGLWGYADYAVENDCPLILQDPWTEIYRFYFESQLDFALSEYEKYQNSSNAFNNALAEFERHYIRNVKPNSGRMIYI